MSTYLVLFVLLLFWGVGPLWATVRTGTSDGAWGDVVWVPAGLPQPEDTVVVGAQIRNMPAGTYGVLIVQPGASLTVSPGVCIVEELQNSGDLRLLSGAAMKLRGNLLNTGTIRDDGGLEMTRNGSVIDGGGPIANLVLNAGPGSTVRAAVPLTLGKLYVAAGVLRVDSNAVTVNAEFASAAPFGEWSIVATTGTITLNGPVYGSARGPVRLGWITGGGTRRYPTPPTTYGVLGNIQDTVTFAASRSVSFSRFLGTVVIDSGAVAVAEGIGTGGVNSVQGTLLNNGTVTAADERYHWRVEGDFINRGTVEGCTLLMTGHSATLRTDSGVWGQNAGLKYFAASGGRLELIGAMTLPILEVGTLTPADSGVVVDAGTSELLIRHHFTSNSARGCRLVTDTLVRLRNTADGIILGNVSFEGFYDSEIAGVFGGIGRTVTVAMPKNFVRSVSIAGTFLQRPNAKLVVRGETVVPPGTIFAAEVMLDTGSILTAAGSLAVVRGMAGGGKLQLIGAAPTLDLRSSLRDSILVQVGGDTFITHLSIVRSGTIPRMTIYPGSTMVYPPGATVNVTGEFRYRFAVQPGCSMMCAAVRPADPTPTAVFPGADSVLTYSDSLGYQPADTIRTGRGYWVVYTHSGVIEQRGTILNPPLLSEVTDGWNLVGGGSVPVTVADIVVFLTARTSPFYTFLLGNDPDSGYGEAIYLEPGKGYLVRFGGAGLVVEQ